MSQHTVQPASPRARVQAGPPKAYLATRGQQGVCQARHRAQHGVAVAADAAPELHIDCVVKSSCTVRGWEAILVFACARGVGATPWAGVSWTSGSPPAAPSQSRDAGHAAPSIARAGMPSAWVSSSSGVCCFCIAGERSPDPAPWTWHGVPRCRPARSVSFGRGQGCRPLHQAAGGGRFPAIARHLTRSWDAASAPHGMHHCVHHSR